MFGKGKSSKRSSRSGEVSSSAQPGGQSPSGDQQIPIRRHSRYPSPPSPPIEPPFLRPGNPFAPQPPPPVLPTSESIRLNAPVISELPPGYNSWHERRYDVMMAEEAALAAREQEEPNWQQQHYRLHQQLLADRARRQQAQIAQQANAPPLNAGQLYAQQQIEIARQRQDMRVQQHLAVLERQRITDGAQQQLLRDQQAWRASDQTRPRPSPMLTADDLRAYELSEAVRQAQAARERAEAQHSAQAERVVQAQQSSSGSRSQTFGSYRPTSRLRPWEDDGAPPSQLPSARNSRPTNPSREVRARSPSPSPSPSPGPADRRRGRRRPKGDDDR